MPSSLQPGHLHVWLVDLATCWPDPATPPLDLLSEDERKRAGTFRFDEDRRRFAGARTALRHLLGRYSDSAPDTIHFEYLEHGKPVMAKEQNRHGLEFNLSHAGDLAAIGISHSAAVGIDVEAKKRPTDIEQIARRFFSDAEVEALFALPVGMQVDGFYNAWTRKEAYIKARGTGLSTPLGSFDVSLRPDEPACLIACREDPAEAANCTLQALDVPAGYAGAVAVYGQVRELQLEEWGVGEME